MPSSIELFREFPNAVMVETGTFHGDGVSNALAAGFQTVFSIELSPDLHQENLKKFSGNPKVKLFCGDSATLLPDIISQFNEPMTFWLDAHHSGEGTARGKDRCPCLRELDVIAKHPIKTHSILIDDMRLFDTDEFDRISYRSLVAAVFKINPFYAIERRHGEVKYDILTARARK